MMPRKTAQYAFSVFRLIKRQATSNACERELDSNYYSTTIEPIFIYAFFLS